ncbi:MAG: threonine--tRNA ligase [Candidatus Saccharibacteria bacterium]
MKITLKDGSVREYPQGTAAIKIAEEISGKLAKNALLARYNGRLVDLATVITEDGTLDILTADSPDVLEAYRHTTSHLLAQAVKRLFPGTMLAIGPAIDRGFYYDFDASLAFSPDDLAHIEEEMQKIIKEDWPIERIESSREAAIKMMREANEPYKVELIEDLPADADISFYKQGEFQDLCLGPHLPSTGKIKAFKLMNVSGAYWRGSEKNKMLQRIYGTAFGTKAELEDYLTRLEEAKQRDHNRIGRELELFTTVDYIGQGLPIMMPKGAKVLQILQRFVEDEEERRGYLLTKTPFMAKSDLYKISGHWQHYRDGMFIIGQEDMDDEVLALRPMTCPFQFQAYLNKTRSYRDLPIRYNETSTLFRNESSGEMHGLIRVRQFTISEGHLVCTPEQVEEEFRGCVDLINYMLTTLGLHEDVSYRFSKWDPKNTEKYIGTPEQWDACQSLMKGILDHMDLEYEEAEGEAAFYGPKLDIQARNVHGKEDTIITVQIDFALAERFGMEYVDSDGVKKYPYVIHRTSIGCYERTLAMMIEKYAGAFPTWLAPVQVLVIPITDRHHEYARKLEQMFRNKGVRVEVDARSEKMGYKIREGQVQKIPYMLVVGDKEAETETVAVRKRKQGDLGTQSVADFMATLLGEIETRQID